MNLFAFDSLPLHIAPIVLAAHVLVGAGAGAIFFRALWWNTRIMIGGGSVGTAVALLAGRFLLLGALLTLSALEGGAPLLAAATGVFVGRFLTLRSFENSKP